MSYNTYKVALRDVVDLGSRRWCKLKKAKTGVSTRVYMSLRRIRCCCTAAAVVGLCSARVYLKFEGKVCVR